MAHPQRPFSPSVSSNAFAFAGWAPLVAVLVALALGYALGLHHYLSLETLRRYQADLSGFVEENAALAAVVYVLIYVLAVSLSFPGASVLTVAGGFMFGCLAGTLLALFAATAGGTVIFLAARTSLGSLLARRAGPRVQRLAEGFRRDGFTYLLVLRLLPIFPFWLVNLAAGIFGMRLVPYVAATAIGIVPATIVFAYLGDGLGTALDAEAVPIALKLGLVLLGVLVLAPIVFRRWRGSGKGERGAPS
jgi:uncharacterized membrane protein YdjX (TVP38/TMEM64 family)